ncbi:hypothetical protein [Alteromonas facilis]|uniref:hypothetical protein n=1 Tax=Alteromonas facilis TaxID=2048004 RepID=UPI000C292281|nr:hypothetical protein [Alteromonas facilis]
MSNTCWQLLAIEPTTDPKSIEQAYQRQYDLLIEQGNTEFLHALSDAKQQALAYAAPFVLDELNFQHVQTLIDWFENALNNSAMRQDPEQWQYFFHYLTDTNAESLNAIRLLCFEMIADYLDGNRAQQYPFDLPPNILSSIATELDWHAHKDALTHYYSAGRVDSAFSIINGDLSPFAQNNKRPAHTPFYYAASLFCIVGIILWLANISHQPTEPLATELAMEWEPDLVLCNEVENAEATAAFERCLELANEDWLEAKKRIAWAYTVEHDAQDWAEAYRWLQDISHVDQHAEFLANIILFMLGEDEQDKLNGERRIREQANLRYAPAEAYLGTIYALGLNLLERDANIMWLLESAYEQDASLISVYDMIQIHVNGLKTRVNLTKARQLLAEYAQSDAPGTVNNTAWFLATLDNNQLHKPSHAVELAETIVKSETGSQNYSYIDTLAAAYAADEQFDNAVKYQQLALSLLTADQPENESEIAYYQERLTRYEQQKSVIYDDLVVDNPRDFFDDIKTDIEQIMLNYFYNEIEIPDQTLSE